MPLKAGTQRKTDEQNVHLHLEIIESKQAALKSFLELHRAGNCKLWCKISCYFVGGVFTEISHIKA